MNLKRLGNALGIRSSDPTKGYSDINLSGMNNLFGSIAKAGFVPGGYDFVPTDGKGGTLDLTGNHDAQWLGLQSKMMQFWAYNYCSPLAGVIDRLAEADSNGIVKFVDQNNTYVKNINKIPYLKRISGLFLKPNPRQTWDDFDNEQIVLCKIFGYCPVFCLRPEGMDTSYTKYMFNINPFLAQPETNIGVDILSDDNNNPIKLWRINLFGTSYEFPAEDVILVKDGMIDSTRLNAGLPISKIAGLDYFISNICAAMEADNVLLKKKGPLGVFSYDAKPDMAGWQPMTTKVQDEVQQDLKRYGMTWAQLQYIVSRVPIKWNSMSFNVQELMTKETVRQGIEGICDRLGYPAELMSGKNATYENRNSAEKFLYQNNIIPFSNRRMSVYNNFFGLNDYKIKLDYNHLPVLQEDIVKSGEARYYLSQSVQMDWEGGRITWNESRTLMYMDEVSGMDIYYSEYIDRYPNTVTTKSTTNAPSPTPKN